MLSHKLIINHALNKKFKRILVFEDDVIIKSGSLLIKQLKGLIKNNVTL